MTLQKRKCILIVGMHRSGTSAMAGLLNQLGLSIGKNLMVANEFNEKGYFENNHICHFNNGLLAKLGGSWDKTFLINDGYADDLIASKEILRKIVNEEFKEENLFLIKDPRISVLLPFYQDVFSEMGIDLHYVIMVRHPEDVFNSLEKRDRFSRDKSYLLWFDHLIKAERNTRNCNRIFICYDDLISDTSEILERIERSVNIGIRPQKNIEGFVEAKLRHYINSENSFVQNEFDTKLLFKILREFCLNPICAVRQIDSLDYLQERHSFYVGRYGNVFSAEIHILDEIEKRKEISRKDFELHKISLANEKFGTQIIYLKTALRSKEELLESNLEKVLSMGQELVKFKVDLDSRNEELSKSKLEVEYYQNLLLQEEIHLGKIRAIYKKQLEELAKVISNKEKELINSRREITSLQAHLSELDINSNRLQDSINLIRTDRNNLRSSWSFKIGWVVTRPIGALYDKMKDLRWINNKYREVNHVFNYALENWNILVSAVGREPLNHIFRNAWNKIISKKKHNENSRNTQKIKGEILELADALKEGLVCVDGFAKRENQKNNILLVGHSASKYIYGGERSFLDLAKIIYEEGFNLIVSLPNRSYEFEALLKEHAIKIYVFEYRWWNTQSIRNEQAIRIFKEIIKNERIDLVHVNTIMILDALLAANELGVKNVLHAREIISKDTDLRSRLGAEEGEVHKVLEENCKHLIANSLATSKEFMSISEVDIVPNAVSDKFFQLSLREIDESSINIGLISSNIEKKGIWDFVNLAETVFKERGDIFFYIIGQETEQVQEIRRQLYVGGLVANIVLAGYYNDSIDAYKDLDIVVNFSHFAESFGRTVIEAMAAGKVPIIYNYGALPELVEDEINGYIVEYRQWRDVVRILLEISNDPEKLLRMGLQARESAKKYHIKNISKMLGDLYRRKLSSIFSGEKKWFETRSSDPMLCHHISNLRIGYFLWHFPVPSETFVLNEIRYLITEGYDVIVFCKESPHLGFKIDFHPQIIKVSNFEELSNKIKETNRNMMHGHFAYPTVTKFLWPACEMAKVPFSFIAHGQDIFKYDSIENNRIVEISKSTYCLRILVPGMFHYNFLLNQGVTEYKLVINAQAVETQRFNKTEIKIQTERSICSVGRFVEKKGFEYLIEAAKILENYGVIVYLYGYGPEEDRYRKIIMEKDITNVVMPGELKGVEAVAKALGSHDFFVQPSVRAKNGDMDGLPTVIIEAMTLGVPIISTRISSISEILIDEYNGLVINERDPVDIAEKVLAMYSKDPAEIDFMVRNGKKLINRVFNIDSSVKFLLRLWQGKGIDIILVTYNLKERIDKILERIYRFTNTPFTLVVVDNASERDTLDYLKDLKSKLANMKLICNDSNLLVGPATNIGLQNSDFKYAVYICSREGYIVKQNWDRDIINFMDDNPQVGLGGTLGYSPSYYYGRDFEQGLPKFKDFRNRDFALNNPCKVFMHVQGGILVVRRSMYDEIGGFSDTVPHNHTDVEYSYYCESMGWQLGSIISIMSLYSKTKPGIESRLTDSHKILHPINDEIASKVERIMQGYSRFCPICKEFIVNDVVKVIEESCPFCNYSTDCQFLFRFLAKTDLLYRNLLGHYLSDFRIDLLFIQGALKCEILGSKDILLRDSFVVPDVVIVEFSKISSNALRHYFSLLESANSLSVIVLFKDRETYFESDFLNKVVRHIPQDYNYHSEYILPEFREVIMQLNFK